MRKVSKPFQRKDRAGWWVRWFENGQKKHKSCSTKKEADHFRQLQYMRLNSDVYSSVPLPWADLKEKYLEWYEIQGLKTVEPKCFLSKLKSLCRIKTSADLNQERVNHYIKARAAETGSAWTVKKSVAQVKALYNWCKENNYAVAPIKFPVIKTPTTQKGAVLSEKELKACFDRCEDKNEKIQFMVSLCTGLRASDVDAVDSITGDLSGIATKTGKPIDAPLPAILVSYSKGFKLSRLSRNKWERIMCDFTRHDLRRTHAQMIADCGNIELASELLQHSSQRITKEFYLKSGKRAAVNAVFEPLLRGWLG